MAVLSFNLLQPKFIHSLLKAADERKKEDERRIERAVHREREAEKGQYDDKEAFVTESFRQKMKELKAEEEKERKKRELEGMVMLLCYSPSLHFVN